MDQTNQSEISSVTQPRIPVVVGKGARLGVAALSGPVDEERLEVGVHNLEALGFQVEQASNLRHSAGFLAGSDEQRLSSFHSLLEDRAIDGIVFARGGHGLLRILDSIDWDLLGARPRWFVGYSDLTPFLYEVGRRTGWMTLHGPMVATEFHRGLSTAEEEAVLSCMAGTYRASWPVVSLAGEEASAGESGGGAAARGGRLMGGCLSMLAAMAGGPYGLRESFRDSVVLLEDIGEAPYKVDRFLLQLENNGLGEAGAVVFGHCRQAIDKPLPPRRSKRDETEASPPSRVECSTTIDTELVDILRYHSSRTGVPFYFGLPVGHGRPNFCMPLGATAMLRGGHLTVMMEP